MLKQFKIIAFILVLLLFASCSGDIETNVENKEVESVVEDSQETNKETENNTETAEDVIKVVDIAGREVEIKHPIDRIIINNPVGADLLFALLGDEAADKIIGIRDGRGNDKFEKIYGAKYPQLLEIDKITLGQGGYDVEKILALRPDLIILLNQRADQGLEELQDVINQGIPIITLSYNIEPLKDRVKNIEILGQVFKKEERAKEISDFTTEQFEIVDSILAEIPEEERIEVHQTHFHGDIPKSFWSWSIIMENAGGKEIANDVNGVKVENGGTLDTEFLIKKDPKVFVMGIDLLGQTKDGTEGLEYLKERIDFMPGWDKLTAIKEKRAYGINYSCALNMETFYANMQLAKWFYPEYFKDIDPEAALEEFYERFMTIEKEGTWAVQLD